MTLVLLFRLSLSFVLSAYQDYIIIIKALLFTVVLYTCFGLFSLSPKSLYKVRGLYTVRYELAFVFRSLRLDGERTATS